MVNRIRELLEARQLSPTQFADLIGVGRPVISHILSERNKPSLEVVQKVLDAFPDISLSWLMKGTGPMLTTGVPAVAPSLGQDASPLQAPPAEAIVAPPAAPVAAAPAPVVPAAVAAPSLLPQPQAFVAFNPAPTTAARPVAASLPPARPLPPKFRPGAGKSAEALPLPAEATTLLPAEPAAAAAPIVAAPAAPTPAPATVVAPPLGATPPAPAVGLDSYGPIAQPLEYQQATAYAPQPVLGLAGQSSGSLAATTSTPPAAEPSMPNPAATLSFLGEPGKAIRRIVIFYRDGSFSDYVPEGQ